MIQAIIFDADGVIITNPLLFSAYLERDYGITREQTLPFFVGKFQDCLIGKADLKEELKNHLHVWGWRKSVDEFLHYWFKIEHNINQTLIDYILDLKKKGIHCYVATNQERYRTEYMLEQMGFKNIFDKVFSSAHLGSKKPEKEFFEKIMIALSGIQKDEVLFFDDTQSHIDAAKEFGWHAYFYKNFEDLKETLQSFLLHPTL